MAMYQLRAFHGSRAWHALRGLDPGAEIELMVGEYEGPFVIDRPLRVVGQGSGSVLWARRGPVIIVQSPGVSLEHLAIEATFDSQDLAILAEPQTNPVLKDVTVRGQFRDMTTSHDSWQLPPVIDLGDLVPQQLFTTFVAVTLTEPIVVDTDIEGLRATIEFAGPTGQCWLCLEYAPQYLRPETLVRGQIQLAGSTNTRRIWVIGRVLPVSAQPVPQVQLMLTNGKKQIFITNGFMLGKSQLSGMPGSQTIGERQSYIAKNVDGSWGIIQHMGTLPRTRLNGELLWSAQRRSISPGSLIQVDQLTLKVEAVTKPPQQSIGPLTLDLGTVSLFDQASPGLITLKNNARQTWNAQVVRTVSWLRVNHPAIQCKGKSQNQVVVELDPSARHLPAGRYTAPSGILITDGDRWWPVDVTVNLTLPQICLVVEPATVDFSLVNPWVKLPVQTVKLHNNGQKDWQGTVSASAPWALLSPEQIVCAAGAEVQIQVSLSADTLQMLPPGTNQPQEALVIEGTGQRLVVTGMFEVEERQTRIDIAPQVLDMGVITKTEPYPAKELSARNAGLKAWDGKVTITVPWLSAMPHEFRCASGQEASIKITVNSLIQHLPFGPLTGQGIVLIEGHQVRQSIDIIGVLAEPKAQIVVPQMLDFGTVAGQAATQQSLRIENNGSKDWTSTLRSTLHWLEVRPTSFTCQANSAVEIVVTLMPTAPVASSGYQPNAIQIVGEGETYSLAVRYRKAAAGAKPPLTAVSKPEIPATKPDQRASKVASDMLGRAFSQKEREDLYSAPGIPPTVEQNALSPTSAAPSRSTVQPRQQLGGAFRARVEQESDAAGNASADLETSRSLLDLILVVEPETSAQPPEASLRTDRDQHMSFGQAFTRKEEAEPRNEIAASGSQATSQAAPGSSRSSRPTSRSGAVFSPNHSIRLGRAFEQEAEATASPTVLVLPTKLNFGQVVRSKLSGALALEITNHSLSIMRGSVRTLVRWLVLDGHEQLDFECWPDQSRVIQVTLAAQAFRATGEYDEEQAIVVEATGTQILVAACVHIT